MPVLIVSY